MKQWKQAIGIKGNEKHIYTEEFCLDSVSEVPGTMVNATSVPEVQN